MDIIKVARNYVAKAVLGSKVVPIGLIEMHRYFKNNGPIQFDVTPEDGELIAVSKNFRYGSIVTAGIDQRELDINIKDAILTAFEVPSVYAEEAKLQHVGEEKIREYAAA